MADSAGDDELGVLRGQIDAVDDQVLDLLNRRARLVKQVGEHKKVTQTEFYQPTRERAILERLTAQNPGPFPSDALRPVFQEIISACLSLELPLQVAYLGPEASYTYMACKRQFGLSARYTPVGTIAGVFEEVDKGLAGYGVVPIENSSEGAVNYTLDSFLSSAADLRICAEIVLEVSHCLLARQTELGQIEKVYSHPQAIAQCRKWLQTHLPRATVVEVASTSLAAQMAHGDGHGAAIASELAAQLYDLRIVRRKLEDHAQNVTRFLVIGRAGRAPTGQDKTSIMFSVKDEPGVLFRVLSAFADERVNLTKIESRPSRRRAWEYIFFVDLDGHEADPIIARAIANVRAACEFLKVLGSYPRAEPPPEKPTPAVPAAAKEGA